jgi:2-haloacid dehalogenase
MNTIDTIIFDLGGVLIDWNPEYVFLDAFNGDAQKTKWFLETICTMAWNENQDSGYPIAQATEDLVAQFPDYETYIRMYYGQWEAMIGGAIEGTVKVLEHFVNHPNYKVVALTNWSSETFPIAQRRFEFLKWFENIVVSGDEKTRKPHKDFFDIAIKRWGITPNRSLFIDDNIANIKAAKALGIHAIHFTTPEQLITDLEAFNIKIQ